jgi:hypothetical protein
VIAPRTRRRAVVVAASAAAVVAALLGPIARDGAAAAACPLQPQLRDTTVNQGLGRAYPTLARGKETLVRLFLSLPSGAPPDASIGVTGATLTVNNGAVSQNLDAYAPATGTQPYIVKRATDPPALDASADPKFVVPAALLTPSNTTNRFTLTLTPKVKASVKTSSSATPVACSVTYPPVTATVEKRTNALRILVVPMGDARQSYASQFPADAQATMQNALTTLAREFPVPDGIGDLRNTSSTGGVRYSVSPTLLDVAAVDPATGTRPLLDPATGKFCGTALNWKFLKPKLSQFLQSWNTLNAGVPSATADRVMGVVSDTISFGAFGHPCAEGYAALGGNQAWVRLVKAQPFFPSISGSTMVMEMAHSMGVVPPNRQDVASPGHSLSTEADASEQNRAYNLTTRSFISQDRTALKLTTGWNDTTTILEPGDWADLQCKLGGVAVPNECTTPGVVGTVQGVGGSPTFVLSGDTDGTVAGTNVVESYFSIGTARSPEFDPDSPYRLIQRDATGAILGPPFGNVGLVVSTVESAHCDDQGDTDPCPPGGTSSTLFSAAVGSDSVTAAETIELWKGQPGSPGAVKLYTRDRGTPPVLDTVTVLPSGGATQRASVTDGEAQANGDSGFTGLSVSADGRYVAFQSQAFNLVAGDTNGWYDIFIRDRQAASNSDHTGKTVRVSLDPAGGEADGPSIFPSLSADGRYVAFQSQASNLVAGDTNGVYDIFVRDRDTDEDGVFDEPASVSTQRVSRSSTEGETFLPSSNPRISADGRFVVFQSDDPTIVDNDLNGATDVFLRDLTANTNEQVSVGALGAQGDSVAPDVSGDGKLVVFESDAPDLVPDDDNASTDVFVRNTVAGTTKLISRTSAGDVGDNDSRDAAISDDGKLVAFLSNANNLVPNDTNSAQDVFVRNRAADTTQRVSVDSQGHQSAGGIPFVIGLSGVDISADGSTVAFWSTAGDLAGPTNGFAQIYAHELGTGSTRRASTNNAGAEGNSDSRDPALTANGRFAVFNSSASNLAAGDSNGVPDVVINNREPPPDDGQQPVSVTTTAADATQAANLRVDLVFTCPDGTAYPIDVGLPPAGVADRAASFETNFDPSLACGNGSLTAVVNDGFLQGDPAPVPETVAPTEAAPKAPGAAVLTPGGETIDQFDSIALRGAGKDADNGELTGSALLWSQIPSEGTCVPVACTGSAVDLQPPPGGWTPGNHTVTLQVTDSTSTSSFAFTTFKVRIDCRQRLCSDGNPGDPAVLHPVQLSKAVSLVRSSPDPCRQNYSGPACTAPAGVTVSAGAFDGDPNHPVVVALCNGQALTGAEADGSGGDGDIFGGCDFGNAVGYGSLVAPFSSVPGSGSLSLDSSGNLPGAVSLQFPSGSFTAYGGSASSNANAVCPPTPAQIAAGWSCVVYVAELDPSDPGGPPLAASFRRVYLKPPAPVVTCGGGPCPNPIPSGTVVTMTGTQLPCKVVQPDNRSTLVYDGACATPWGLTNDLAVLLKRPGFLATTVPATSITTAVNGNYTLRFTMPPRPSGAGAYKLVVHAEACSFPCDSGKLNVTPVAVNL